VASVRELYRARVEGRFGPRHWLQAFIISTRWFAALWILLVYVAGSSWSLWRHGVFWLGWDTWLAVLAAVEGILLLSHFYNNYRDYEKGIDRGIDVEEALRAKPYTAANLMVPLGITPVWAQKLWALGSAALAAAGVWYAAGRLPWGWQLWPLLAWGYVGALTYTELAKPRGLGELWVFLKVLTVYEAAAVAAHGFDPAALLAAAPLGFAGAFFYSIDQYQDARSDFARRVRNFAILLWRSGVPLSVYMMLGYTFYVALTHMAVTLGVQPPAALLLAAATWPAMMVIATLYHVDRGKALKLGVFMFIYMAPLQYAAASLIHAYTGW